jgi:hypothetical protein
VSRFFLFLGLTATVHPDHREARTRGHSTQLGHATGSWQPKKRRPAVMRNPRNETCIRRPGGRDQ